MLNQIVIVGEVQEVPVLKETSSGVKFSNLLVRTTRSFKNSDGVYESDILSCIMWRGIAESSVDYCKVGNIVGIKGRVQSRPYQSDEGVVFYNHEIIVEKISFISNNDSKEDKEKES